jgi:hypothetical protein
MTSSFFKVTLAVLFALPGFGIALLAFPRLSDGFAVDSAIPVPNYMLAGIALPHGSYDRASASLKRGANADGDAAILAVEAAIHAGAPAGSEIPQLERGLSLEPGSARGWLLLAEASAPVHSDRAASALSQSLVLAPYDFWLAGRRSRLSAVLWSDLDVDGRAMARRQVVRLWEEPLLRTQLVPLFQTAEGRALLKTSFAAAPDELRVLNRWVSAEARKSAAP